MKIFLILLLTCPLVLMAQTVSNTYTAGDIPTSLPPFNPTCNGPLTTLAVNLPGGGPWVVTGIDNQYNMLAQSTGWKSHQRSQVYCQNTERIEASVYLTYYSNNRVIARAACAHDLYSCIFCKCTISFEPFRRRITI